MRPYIPLQTGWVSNENRVQICRYHGRSTDGLIEWQIRSQTNSTRFSYGEEPISSAIRWFVFSQLPTLAVLKLSIWATKTVTTTATITTIEKQLCVAMWIRISQQMNVATHQCLLYINLTCNCHIIDRREEIHTFTGSEKFWLFNSKRISRPFIAVAAS